MVDHNIQFLKHSIELANKSVEEGGGPFGAIVVKNNEIIAEGNNLVTKTNDPTAHAEITAIRKACSILNSFELTDCIIYSSCEPCPMCLGAIYWARPKAVYFASNRFQAADAGFDDEFIYKELDKPLDQRDIPFKIIELAEAQHVFDKWKGKIDKVEY